MLNRTTKAYCKYQEENDPIVHKNTEIPQACLWNQHGSDHDLGLVKVLHTEQQPPESYHHQCVHVVQHLIWILIQKRSDPQTLRHDKYPVIDAQQIKFMLAPCHSPVARNTTNRLTQVLLRPLRLPPRGM